MSLVAEEFLEFLCLGDGFVFIFVCTRVLFGDGAA